jgi:hypothetical protein
VRFAVSFLTAIPDGYVPVMQLQKWKYYKTRERIIKHLLFWLCCITLLTITYGIGLPSFWVSLKVVILLTPINLFYFYTVSYWVIPKYLYTKRYIKLFFLFVCCSIISACLFRVLEITLVDPYLYKFLLAANPKFVWHKLNGSFWQQLQKPVYIINAFEQSNLVIWVALFFKFFMMWFDKGQAAIQAELNFLKSQIQPHFLFNTLNNLYALTLNQSPESPAIVLGLSNILRYMLYECNTETVLLKREIEILQNFIALEKIRYEERLDINFSIRGRICDQYLPPLLMLPLVENAFKHGISESMYDAWINIDLYAGQDNLTFKVSNSKPDTMSQHQAPGKIGNNNVKKRLELLHNNKNQLKIYDEESIYVAVLDVELTREL